MGSTSEHQKVVDDIVLAIGSRPDGRAWKNVTGVGKVGPRIIAFGLKGSSDVFAIKAPYGRLFCFEVKTGNAVQTVEQKSFEKMITKFGGVYKICRNSYDALSVFDLPPIENK